MTRWALYACCPVLLVVEVYRRGYVAPVAGGVAAWGHCLFGTEAMSRWLRTNADYEPEAAA